MNIKIALRRGMAFGLCASFVLFGQLRSHREAAAHFSSYPAVAAAIPMDFYRDITGGIDSVDGHFTVDLNKTSKRWRSTVTGTRDVEWKYSPAMPPNAQPVMEVFFKFKNGFLQDGSGGSYVEFKPEITVNLAPAITQPKVISKIFFDANGRPTRYEGEAGVDGNVKSWDVVAGVNFAEHMRFALAPATLFLKGPFSWTTTPLEAGGSGPFLKRMSLTLSELEEARGGLEANLSEQAAVEFSKSVGAGTFDNTIAVARSSRLKFKALSYDFLTQELRGTISSLDFTLHKGRLENEGLILRIDDGARLAFAKVEFQDTPAGPSSLKCTDGKLAGRVLLGSRVVLAGGARETVLFADSGSTVDLESLNLELSGQASSITVGGTSRLDFQLAGGRLPLAGTDFITFKAGRSVLENLSGTWRAGVAPTTSGTLSQLDCQVRSGVFSIVAGTGIRLRAGNMQGKDLAFNSATAPVVTGAFSDVTFDVEDGATLEIPGRFLLVARSATRLIANDSGQPFSIRAGLTTAAGRFRAVIPFWTCFMPPAGSPVIRDSMLKSTLFLNGSGSIGGTDEVVDYTCCAR